MFALNIICEQLGFKSCSRWDRAGNGNRVPPIHLYPFILWMLCPRPGWMSPGQPGLVPDLEVGVPACGTGLELDDPWGPFQLQPFYDSLSMIIEQVPLKHNGKKHLNIRFFCKPGYLLYARELLPFCIQKGNKLRKNSHLGKRAHFIMSATKDE